MTEPPQFGLCPNCQSDEIIRVEGGATSSGAASVISLGAFSAVPVARLVCLRCGFVRDWVDRQPDLQRLRDKYGWQLRPR